MRSHALRFVVAAGLIAAVAILLQTRARSEVFPSRLPLKQFPAEIAGWTSTDVPIDQETLDVLGHGDFLHRVYGDEGGRKDIDLFIAYFPSQRAGDTIHSPKNCLPGSGWSPVESRRISLSWPGHDPFPVNRYVIVQGEERRVVLYWYWAHNRGIASEYWAKYFLVSDSIKMNRSDGALVRITTPLFPGETADAAQQRIVPFAGEVMPLLGNYIPR